MTPLASGEGEAPAELESRQDAAQQELRPPGVDTRVSIGNGTVSD